MLSTTAKHAVRALVRLAALPRDRVTLGRDLAKAADIPPNYLAKILWALRSVGIISATRGIRGGYRLQRKPEEVRLMEIVELFDKPRTATACLLATNRPCRDEHPCAAHEAWSEVKRTYIHFLENTTLATLVARELAKTGVGRPRALRGRDRRP
jgi:Rrf2 family transcriptional regulator, iron-sulfur cluster assembly transcription factor